MSAGHGALAVAAGVVAATGTRRADLAVLVAAGATRARIVATVAVETGTAATLGIVLGLAVAVPPLAALASGLSTATGTAVAPVPDVGVTALAAGTCLLVAVLAGAVTAARAVRSSSSVPERRHRSGRAAHRY
ncbi:FtsX-like permease family protein [Pseudonocardia alni]|uniref:FtsX-like permease family protein n=1 Tax=Pseudonocardia alni TaxID=33907 RepID=UPI0033C6C7E0